MSKGEDTRAAILDTALGMARIAGLEGLTIGALARQRCLSKSGVFAHFGSKEELQLAVLERARESFIDEVLRPAFQQPRGIARIRAVFANWLRWSAKGGGCPMIPAAYEFDDRPGPVRERVADTLGELRRTVVRCVQLAVDCGDLQADSDAQQLATQIIGLVMATHVEARLLDDDSAHQRGSRALASLLQAHIANTHH